MRFNPCQAIFLHYFLSLPSCEPKHLRLIAKHDNWQNLWKRIRGSELVRLGIPAKRASRMVDEARKLNIRAAVELVTQNDIKLISIKDALYPDLLREIYDPPALIYCLGNYQILCGEHHLAVVGTRKSSQQGLANTRNLISKLTKYDLTVISGGALGIDTVALQTAIKLKIPAVAVLGSGVLNPTPALNRQLFTDILEDGLILSEFPPLARPTKYTFPARNRLISGLTQATVVIEAPAKSGAIITADFANEQNRNVFALPGAINNPSMAGTNRLIAENKAQLLIDHEQALIAIGIDPSKPPPPKKSLSELETEALDMLLAGELSLGQIEKKLRLNTNELLTLISRFELEERI